MNGKKNWYIVDGWIPVGEEEKREEYCGHESLMILNCNDQDAKIYLDIFFPDKDPVENIELIVPAKRSRCFRMEKPDMIGGVKLKRLEDYSMRVRSDIEVVVQFGRMDVTQKNLSYIGLIGYSE